MLEALLGLLVAATATQPASSLDSDRRYQAIRDLRAGSRGERRAAVELLLESGDTRFVAPLVDALFFTPVLSRQPLVEVLEDLSGEDHGQEYYLWMEMVGRREDLSPPPGYLAWKRELFSRIDPAYGELLYLGAPHRIRLEELVWGGARVDGIPPLEDPPSVPARRARVMRDDELIFGVELAGERRAYPLRYVSWHEMVNDVVGGEPITVSY